MYMEIANSGAGQYIAHEFATNIEQFGAVDNGVFPKVEYFGILQGVGVQERHDKSPLQYPLVGGTSPHVAIVGRWSSIGEEDFDILSAGPDEVSGEEYDEAWAATLDYAVFTETDGTKWRLFQGGGAPDVYLVSDGETAFDDAI